MKVKGFAHLFLSGHWYTVFSEQTRILLTSGLYDECEEIRIGCIGSQTEKAFLQKYFVDVYPKLKIKYHSENPLEYEFPTLRLIVADNSEYVGFYFHTKAVTRPFEVPINHWRSLMNESILNRWQAHRVRVESGFDVSSMGYLKSPNHFSGNFWWFRRSYIDKLPAIDSMDLSYRWGAEQWICRGNPNFYADPHVEPGDAVFTMKYKDYVHR